MCEVGTKVGKGEELGRVGIYWGQMTNAQIRKECPMPDEVCSIMLAHGGHGLAGASFCIRTRRESIPVCGGVLQRKITFEGGANSREMLSKI